MPPGANAPARHGVGRAPLPPLHAARLPAAPPARTERTMRDSTLPYSLSQTLMSTGNAMGTMDMTPTTKLKKPDPLWPSAFTCVCASTAAAATKHPHVSKRASLVEASFPRASLGTRLEQQRDEEEGAEVELRDGVHEV
jgi:hypothetical protein